MNPRSRRGQGRKSKLERLEARLTLDSTVVINEIMYHPTDANEALEWVELYNQLSTDMDLTGWRLADGIDFDFADNTVLEAGQYLVVAKSPEALQNATGFDQAIGPFARRLNNAGDRIRLLNNSDRIMSEVDFDDRGPWPIGADGSGASLAKVDPYRSSEAADNWSFSSNLQGTPGSKNDVVESTLVLNEISAAGNPVEIELWNRNPSTVNLSDFSIQIGTANRVELPAIQLSSLESVSLTSNELGNPPWDVDTEVFLFASDGNTLYDAIDVQKTARARFPDGSENWLYPTGTSFGSPNTVELHDEIVINEIMFHHSDVPKTPAVIDSIRLLGNESVWSYSDSNTYPGDAWTTPDFDDGEWKTGTGLFANDSAQVQNADVPLEAGASAYYFRTHFPFEGDPAAVAIELQLAVNDGAVVYLNGVEAGRFNMPEGEVNHETLAFVSITDPLKSSSFSLNSEHLVQGQNTLAVEVHQAAETIAYYRFEDDGPGGSDLIDELTQADHGDLFGNAGFSSDVPSETIPNTGQPNTQSYHAQAGGPGIGYALFNQDGSGVPFVFNDAEGPATLEWFMKVPHEEQHHSIFWTDMAGGGTGFNIFYNSSFTQQPNTNRLVAGGLERDVRIIGTYINDQPLELDTWHHIAIVRSDLGNNQLNWKWFIDGEESESHEQTTTGGPWPNTIEWSLTGRPGEAFNVLIDEVRMSKAALQPNQFLNAIGGAATVAGDTVFSAELHSHETLSPETPRHESSEEWIELFNRSDQSVNLGGWSLADGIDFKFSETTWLEPQEYAVVARDAEILLSRFPDIRVLGEYSGRLADSTDRIQLLDGRGNPADEVTYFDAKPWPTYADGRHASLELIDPDTDNSRPESWTASDETNRSQWHTYSYRGVAGPGDSDNRDYHELVIGMLDRGEFLIDDIRVVEEPDSSNRQLIQNSSFDDGSSEKWRIIGNHSGTVVVDPDDLSNHVLHLIASGRTDDIHNHVETTLRHEDSWIEVTPGTEYEISFRAKWIGGGNLLNTRLYFHEVQQTHELIVPKRHGTPGQQNSTYQVNAGPTFADLSHSPVVPDENEPVTVSITVNDPDTTAEVRLYYNTGDEWQSVEMITTEDNRFAGEIPGHKAKTKIQFYVAATDSLGATAFYPQAGESSRAMIAVQDGRARLDELNNLRIIMDFDDARSTLTWTRLMSNQRLGATVVFNESEVYYDVGVRLSGASSSRQGDHNGYSIQFNSDRLFLGVHDIVTVDRNNLNEIFVRHLINRAGDVPGMYNDAIYFVGPLSSRRGYAQLRMARYDDVFLSSQFEDGNEGFLFEKELTYRQNLSRRVNRESLKQPQGYSHPIELNPDIQDFGDNKEAYRWHWLPKNHRSQDQFSQVIALNQAFSLTGTQLEQASAEIIDVDQWMRTLATMRLFGNRDFYSQPSGAHGHWKHNFFIYVRPVDNKVLIMPWDIDENFQIPTSSTLYGVGNVANVIQLPNNLHHYLGHMHDVISQSFNRDYLLQWGPRFTNILPTANFSMPTDYISSRIEFVESQFPDQVEFQVKNPTQTTIDAESIQIDGTGWINVRDIHVRGQSDPLVVRWTSPTEWSATVPLQPGKNVLNFEAFDFRGNLIPSNVPNQLTITSIAPHRKQLDFLRITELNYHPSNPTAGETEAGFNRDDDFEFIEVTNIGEEPLSLVGASFSAGIEFDFSSADINLLQSGESVVVVEDIEAFRFRYGANLPIAGQWTGGLDGNGELLILEDRFGSHIHEFAFDDSTPWPDTADGDGATLEIINPNGDYTAATNWRTTLPNGVPAIYPNLSLGDLNQDGELNAADIDTLSVAIRNSEFHANLDLDRDGLVNDNDRGYLVQKIFATSYGDSDLDGVFNSRDLVLVFQAGEYEDNVPANSSWSEGDWDGNGDFGSADLVLAFQSGRYSIEAAKPPIFFIRESKSSDDDSAEQAIIDPSCDCWPLQARAVDLAFLSPTKNLFQF